MTTNILPVESIDPERQVDSGRLIASVYPLEDRTGHGFWWQEKQVAANESQPILIMTSCEGTPDDVWPASSPFQQIVREDIGTDKKPVLLAVGMAGKTHWSGTIEGDAMNEAIAMDFAARVNILPDFVGSTYVLNDAWHVVIPDIVESSIHSVMIKHTTNQHELLLDSIGSNPIRVLGNRITITHQADFPPTKKNQTLRWRYVLRSTAN